MSSGKESYYFLDCSFHEKDEAKALGARFIGGEVSKWYVPKTQLRDIHRFNTFRPLKRFYLQCPIHEKDQAKRLGAKWDRYAQSWYIECPRVCEVPAKFSKWIPKAQERNNNNNNEQAPTVTVAASAVSLSAAADHKKQQREADKPSPKRVDWDSLPKVTTQLTIVQLLCELLHRHPNTKGTSNKPKSWFIEQLGEQSVLSTSPQVKAIEALSQHPVISQKLTVAQLKTELLSRSHDKVTGLYRMTKPELLKTAGEGSLWTTAFSEPDVANPPNLTTTVKENQPRRNEAKSNTNIKSDINSGTPRKKSRYPDAVASHRQSSTPAHPKGKLEELRRNRDQKEEDYRRQQERTIHSFQEQPRSSFKRNDFW